MLTNQQTGQKQLDKKKMKENHQMKNRSIIISFFLLSLSIRPNVTYIEYAKTSQLDTRVDKKREPQQREKKKKGRISITKYVGKSTRIDPVFFFFRSLHAHDERDMQILQRRREWYRARTLCISEQKKVMELDFFSCSSEGERIFSFLVEHLRTDTAAVQNRVMSSRNERTKKPVYGIDHARCPHF